VFLFASVNAPNAKKKPPRAGHRFCAYQAEEERCGFPFALLLGERSLLFPSGLFLGGRAFALSLRPAFGRTFF